MDGMARFNSLSIYGALATSHKGKSRVDAEADFDRLFICIVGVECGVMQDVGCVENIGFYWAFQ